MTVDTTTKPCSEAETVLTVRGAAQFLHISESVVRRLIREQRIPYFRVNRRVLLHRPALEQWIRTLTVQPQEQSSDAEAARTAQGLLGERR